MISDNVSLSGTNIAQADRTSVTAPAERLRNAGTQKTDAASREDQVRLSGLTGRIAGAMAVDSAQRETRVAELTEAVRSGAYKVNAMEVAGALLDESLASHAAGE